MKLMSEMKNIYNFTFWRIGGKYWGQPRWGEGRQTCRTSWPRSPHCTPASRSTPSCCSSPGRTSTWQISQNLILFTWVLTCVRSSEEPRRNVPSLGYWSLISEVSVSHSLSVTMISPLSAGCIIPKVCHSKILIVSIDKYISIVSSNLYVHCLSNEELFCKKFKL